MRRISLNTRSADLVETVQQAAAAADLGACRLGPLHYVGPSLTAENLRTLAALHAEEVTKLPPAIRNALADQRPSNWPRLTEPRALIASVVAQRGWQLAGGERIPHDLWPAGSLPPLTLAEQLTVLLAGFDLTYNLQPQRQTIEVLPIPQPLPLISRRYRLRYPAAEAEGLQKQFPNLKLRLDGEWAVIDARLEEHERLAEWLAGPAARENHRPATGPGRQVYSLRVTEQPVRSVLNALSKQLSLPIEFDDEALQAAGLSLDTRVTFDVEDASQDELLKAALNPARLDFRRNGERITIVPRDGREE
jgi:hypothetical protein